MTIDNNQTNIHQFTDVPRAGWEKAFNSMEQDGDDAVLDNFETIQHARDETEWQW